MVVVYTHACTHTKHSHNINEQITLFFKKAKALHCCGIYCHDYIENIAVTDEKRHRKIFAFSRPMFEHTGIQAPHMAPYIMNLFLSASQLPNDDRETLLIMKS